jgi:hypothetical protein
VQPAGMKKSKVIFMPYEFVLYDGADEKDSIQTV